MISMGDEVRRTQRGNNNAYCQDNEISWMDWSLLDKHLDVRRFVRLLAERRLLRDLGPERERKSLHELIHSAVKSWHGVKLYHPDWSDNSHSVALNVELENEGIFFHFILNAWWEPLSFELPEIGTAGCGPWRRWIDTSLELPDDIVSWQCAAPVPGSLYRVGPRSTVVLIAGGSQFRKLASTPRPG